MTFIISTISSKKIFPKLMLVTALLFVTILFTPTDVYANHLSQDMKWQLVYISHNSACSNYDIQMTRTFSEITSGYMELYQFDNVQFDIKL